MAARHALDGLLARTLFTRAEARPEYSEGFRGHPDLGVLFFADLLGALEDMRAQGQPDELNAMVDRMRADLDRGETVQVLLTGSIFGGTGASGIPAVSRYLRHRFAGDTDRFVMGAVLMLPYYRVPPPRWTRSAKSPSPATSFWTRRARRCNTTAWRAWSGTARRTPPASLTRPTC